MIVTLELDPKSLALIQAHAKAAGAAQEAFAGALGTSVVAGAEEVRSLAAQGSLGFRMQHPGSGLAASIMGWMIDEAAPLAAIGVPSNAPAARYAAIHEFGGTILPKSGKALAIPISAEAKNYASPRDMEGLTLIPRRGRPPLLVREISGGRKKARFEVHWVLVPSVTLPATHWFSEGVRLAAGVIKKAFESRLREYLRKWH
jgi:hypothetical protein